MTPALKNLLNPYAVAAAEKENFFNYPFPYIFSVNGRRTLNQFFNKIF